MTGPHELYEEAPCGLMTTAPNGLVEQVNETFCQWSGYAREELIGHKHVHDLLSIGSRIFHQTHWIPLLVMQGSVAEVHVELVHRSGKPVPMLVNAVRRGSPPSVQHHIAFFVATDRRKYEQELLAARRRAEALLESERAAQVALAVSESRLRLAIESASLLVWGIDVATGEPSYEERVRDLLGLDEGEALNAESYRSCIHEDDREAERRRLAAALDPQGNGRYELEHRLLDRKGGERVVRSSGLASFDASGKLESFSGVLLDVTEWRQAERVLRDREREARTRAMFAEELVGIVSHDLRTPLNAIGLGASMLATGQLAPPQAKLVTRILSANQRANRLIGDLLDFTVSRLGGGLRVAPSAIDAHVAVGAAVEELRLAWPGRTIAHHTVGEATTAYADGDRLAQVVTNLTGNALAYGSSDRAVTVSSGMHADRLELAVQNFGPPIPAELMGEIFEPLRRGEQQVELGSRSVGLGLYIVRQIIDAHRGTVDVRSTEEDGTTFRVVLPSRPE